MSKSPSGKKSPKKNHKDKTMLYNDKCSKLEIALTLNGKTDTIFIDNKENISAIRDMVYNIYYPIQGKFQLIYKLKDISPFEDIPLYKYFKNLMKIAITVNPINTQNLLSRNELSTFNNSLPDVTEIDKNEASLAANQSQLSNGQNPLLEKDRLICNECHNKIISNFCRNCNLFLCKNCSEKYSSRHHDHLYVNVNIANIEKSAKNYKDIVSKDCFMTGKKYEEYREIFKDIIDEFNNNKEGNISSGKDQNIIKESQNEDNIINENANTELNNNLESINNMINQDNADNNNNNEEKKNEEDENNNLENNNENNDNITENKKEEKNEEKIEETNNKETTKNNLEEIKKNEKRTVDIWLTDVNEKIEKLSENIAKNDGSNNPNSSLILRDEENNYEYTYKKLQKINAEKNKKDLETIFNEMHEIDVNIKNIDNNLEQCLSNSGNSKISGKILKDLNKSLDNVINKLLKNVDIKGKIKENSSFENI